MLESFNLTPSHNQRELTRKAKVIIEMHDHSTSIFDPNQPNAEPKKFSFDYSYWSHDGFSEKTDGYLAPESAKYADQVAI